MRFSKRTDQTLSEHKRSIDLSSDVNVPEGSSATASKSVGVSLLGLRNEGKANFHLFGDILVNNAVSILEMFINSER